MGRNQEVYSYKTNLHKYIIKNAVYKAPDKSRFDNLGTHSDSSKSCYLRKINNLIHGYQIDSKRYHGFDNGNYYLTGREYISSKQKAKLIIYRNGRIVSEFMSEKTNDEESFQTTEVKYYMNGYLLTYNFSKLDSEKLNIDHPDFDKFEGYRIADYEMNYRRIESITFQIDGITRSVSKSHNIFNMNLELNKTNRNRTKYLYKTIDFYNNKNKKHGLSLTWYRINPYEECLDCRLRTFGYSEVNCKCVEYENKSTRYINHIDNQFQYHEECPLRAENRQRLIDQFWDSEYETPYQRELVKKIKNYSKKFMTFDLSVFYPVNKRIADQYETIYSYKIIKEVEYNNNKKSGIWREHEYKIGYFDPAYGLVLTTQYKKDIQHGIRLTYQTTITTPRYNKHYYNLQIYIHGIQYGRTRLVMKKEKI